MQSNDIIIFFATVVASTEFFFLLLVLISFHVWYLRNLKTGLLVLVSSILLGVTVTGLKVFFAVPRPVDSLVEASGYAFPSGHAAGVMFLVLVLDWYLVSVLQLSRIWLVRVVLVLCIGLVGYSRVYLGVHTFEQVFAGLLVGGTVGWLFRYSVLRLRG